MGESVAPSTASLDRAFNETTSNADVNAGEDVASEGVGASVVSTTAEPDAAAAVARVSASGFSTGVSSSGSRMAVASIRGCAYSTRP